MLVSWLLKGYVFRFRPALRYTTEGAIEDFPQYSSSLWSPFIGEHASGVNARHSFPSFDSASAHCVAAVVYCGLVVRRLDSVNYGTSSSLYSAMQDVAYVFPRRILALAVVAGYGRIYALAHHVLDVIFGAIVGWTVTCTFGLLPIIEDGFAPQGSDSSLLSSSYVMHLPCIFAVIVCIGMFLFLPPRGPFYALLLGSAAVFYLPNVSWICVGSSLVFLYTTSRVYDAQGCRHKSWVVGTVKQAFENTEDPKVLPPKLLDLVKKKRAEFLEEALVPGPYPGNIYLAGKVRGLKRMYATWEHLDSVSDFILDAIYIFYGRRCLY